MLARTLPILSLFVPMALTACAPLVRLGDVEPPPGTQTLVDIEVRPERKRAPSSGELAAVVGDGGIGVLATASLPEVSSDTVEAEVSADVQGLSVPAEDAIIDEAELATDARRIESIYMARGFFRARNLGHHVVERAEDRAEVEFDVRENRPTRVAEIRFLGACEIEGDPDEEARRRRRALCGEVAARNPVRVGDV
jgi:hypothetical protein